MSILKDGYPFIVVPLLIGAASFAFGRHNPAALSLGMVCILLALFCAFFFRDPERVITPGDRLVISPCDGTVMEVGEENGVPVVRVFLSVFNVHLQRSPVNGTVKSVTYVPGKFLPAMNVQAHVVNEQNIIVIDTPQGEFTVKQIAGLLARRCVSWVKPGDTVARGGKIGLIKFSSQVDLYLPKGSRVLLKPGDKVAGGITVFAEMQG